MIPLQIVAQVLAFVMFFLLLCGTYLFRVGLISVLSRYFKGVMGSTLVYLIATIVLVSWLQCTALPFLFPLVTNPDRFVL